jgi:hypothetical protein
MRLLLLPVLCACAVILSAEIIDQIAATVDDQAITTSQVAGEIRVTAFINGQTPDFSGASRRKTAERLVEQLLVAREMQLTHFPQPERSEIEGALKQLEARASLDQYRVSEAQVVDGLRRQAALLRFIEVRFGSEVQVSEADAMLYYENVYLPELRRKGIKPEPGFEEAREASEKAVAAQLTDKRVDAWLKEARSRARITYQEDAFQ